MTIRNELTHLWKQFVVQCESIENRAPERFVAGMMWAAKCIRRSVDSPKYNKHDFPFFHRKPLSTQFRERAENTRIDAQVYFLKTATEQPTAYKQMMDISRMWEEAAKMAEENGD